MQKVIVIVPAYNPEKPFAAFVRALAESFEVLVVNDGSAPAFDEVFQEAEKAGAVLLCHGKNRGKGAALKTAIAHLLERDGNWAAVTADADGQHSLKDVREVARLAVENPDSLVLGVRNFKNMPRRSRFGNTVTRISFYLATRRRISDTQTGLRGFSRRTAERMVSSYGDRYEYEMNVLLDLKKWNIPVLETVIDTIYEDGNLSSHFHPIRDSLIVFAQLIKHVAASLVCTALDWLVYLALLQWTHISPEWAYLAARVVSTTVNYQLARRLVFRTRADWRTTLAYYMLALSSVSTGALLVMAFTGLSASPSLEKLIKLPVDVFLFFINFFLQKYVIFTDDGRQGCPEKAEEQKKTKK